MKGTAWETMEHWSKTDPHTAHHSGGKKILNVGGKSPSPCPALHFLPCIFLSCTGFNKIKSSQLFQRIKEKSELIGHPFNV